MKSLRPRWSSYNSKFYNDQDICQLAELLFSFVSLRRPYLPWTLPPWPSLSFSIFSYSDLNNLLDANPAALAVLPGISVLLLCLLLYRTLTTNRSRNNGSRVPFSLASSSFASTPPVFR